MRTWKLVSGLVSICVGLYVFFVAQVAGSLASLFSDYNPLPLTLAGFAVLCGGICSIVSRNEEKIETLLTIGCYGLSFLLIIVGAIAGGGADWQLVLCIFWCLACAVVSSGTYYLNLRGMTVQDLVKTIQSHQPKPQQGSFQQPMQQGGFGQPQDGFGQPQDGFGQPQGYGQPMQQGQPQQWQQPQQLVQTPQQPAQQQQQMRQPVQRRQTPVQRQQPSVQPPVQQPSPAEPVDDGYDFFADGEDDF